jgi:hypothetical protein
VGQLLIQGFNGGQPSGSRNPGMGVPTPRLNVRARELIGPQQSPDPLRYGDTPARPATQQIFQEHRPRSWRAVMRDTFVVPLSETIADHTILATGAQMPRGIQQPFRERANIEPPRPEAYGSGFALRSRIYGATPNLIPVPTG